MAFGRLPLDRLAPPLVVTEAGGAWRCRRQFDQLSAWCRPRRPRRWRGPGTTSCQECAPILRHCEPNDPGCLTGSARGCYIKSSCLREIVSGDLLCGLITAFEELEELSADGVLEAALGVPRGLPFTDSAGNVGTGDRIETDADQGDRMECPVELPVSAAGIGAMPAKAANAASDRARTSPWTWPPRRAASGGPGRMSQFPSGPRNPCPPRIPPQAFPPVMEEPREPVRRPASVGAIEFEREVPPCGHFALCQGGQHVWAGPAFAGRIVTLWADGRSIHVTMDGHLVKTIASRTSLEDLHRVKDRFQGCPAGHRWPPRPYPGIAGGSSCLPGRRSRSNGQSTVTASSDSASGT